VSERTNAFAAVTAIILLGIGFFLIGTGLYLMLQLEPTTTTTTSTTTTTAPPTTTTTTIGLQKTLRVLALLDVSLQNMFEFAFLASPFAQNHNITDI
jgi:hypothetical protein